MVYQLPHDDGERGYCAMNADTTSNLFRIPMSVWHEYQNAVKRTGMTDQLWLAAERLAMLFRMSPNAVENYLAAMLQKGKQ
jgi:hypothetical protein